MIKCPLILYFFLNDHSFYTEIIIFITKLSPWYYSNSNSCEFAINKFIW